LRLVVLNSCLGTQGGAAEPFSSVGAGLVRAGVPAVIAMQFEISDHAAQEVAETFYTSLALNFPVDAAVTEARRKIFLSDRDSLEWATPILYMQVPDGRLFQFSDRRSGPQPKAPEAGRSPAGDPTPAHGEETLDSKAAKRYQAGEEAMTAGDWATAVKGFKGALYYVPNYRDAAQKFAICENRLKATELYAQAQQLFGEKNYDGALQALAEVQRLDPRFVDPANIQSLAECGQIYRQAISQLQARNRDRGAELLREVISRRPDFEDAGQRLEQLAEGGDGLYGVTANAPPRPMDNWPPAQPPPNQPVYQPPVQPQSPPVQPSGSAPRLYQVANPDPQRLAEEIRQYFFTNGYESQIIQQGAVSIVQGKKTGLRSLVGMGQAATVMIESNGNNLKVDIGGGKWLEQGAAIAVSMIVLWPLLITGGVGMAQQKKLIDVLWRTVDNYVMTRGGQRVA